MCDFICSCPAKRTHTTRFTKKGDTQLGTGRGYEANSMDAADPTTGLFPAPPHRAASGRSPADVALSAPPSNKCKEINSRSQMPIL